jgi:hypothetical protein
LGGEIGNPALHNRRLILGAFPWKFAGGEAAFCRAVAWIDESAKSTRKTAKKTKRK